MFVILVYDTAAERNAYLHWVQRSVFQGELSTAQYRSLTTELKKSLDLGHDSIRVYRLRSPYDAAIDCLGRQDGHTDTIV